MADVVTGEAVVLEVRVAQLPSRALALLIDGILQGLAIYAVGWVWGQLGFVAEQAVVVAVAILLSALILVGYPVAAETLSRGRSVGKLVFGLRVVSDDGGPERFRQALFRGLAGVVEFWFLLGAPALITSLISSQGKRLGDLFAGTIVISERGPRQAPPPEMPPWMAPWARTLELSRLPEGIAAAARQYLSRWHQLAPGVRHEMGLRIAAEFASYVSPPPPPGEPPYVYLAAVLAERRHRTEARLARQMSRGPLTSPGRPPLPGGPATPAAAAQWHGPGTGQWQGPGAGQWQGPGAGQWQGPAAVPPQGSGPVQGGMPGGWHGSAAGAAQGIMRPPPPTGLPVPLPPPAGTPGGAATSGGFVAPA
ncbi:RDD family protein [Sphaerisporangium sp. B11E5]|uniref:RDD family protein n=1 Tax=Sphaerisporangium sp. B11E5 TaxID=3153563 RepID=UPI00325C53F8